MEEADALCPFLSTADEIAALKARISQKEDDCVILTSQIASLNTQILTLQQAQKQQEAAQKQILAILQSFSKFAQMTVTSHNELVCSVQDLTKQFLVKEKE